jgi:hypothetical protein
MKRLFLIVCSALAIAVQTGAQGVVKITAVNFASLPADGDSVTINGSVRTFKTVVGAVSTQVAIGATTNLTAANYAAQLASYPYTDVSVSLNGGSVYLIGKVNASMTASFSGAWGNVNVTTQTLTNYPTMLPFSSYPPASRALMGNLLVDAIANYPTLAIPATATALSNFFQLANANFVIGANIFSNANQMWIKGILTNAATTNMVFEHTLKLMVTQGAYLNGANLAITNETPLMDFYDTVGGANQKRTRVIADLNGLNWYFYNDAMSAYSNVFSIARNSTYGSPGATFRTSLAADSLVNTLLSGLLSTNLIFVDAVAGQFGSIMLKGNAAISNTAPTLTIHDTDAASGSQKFLLKADANVLQLAFADDAGAIPLSPRGAVFTVSRTHGTDATLETMNVYPAVNFNGTVQFLSGDIVGTTLGRFGNGAILGTGAGTTLPTGASQALLLAPGAGPSGTLSGSSILWSSGGELFFRNGLASEGDAIDSRVYNRLDEVFGAGTDYTLTGSTAFVDFGTTDPKVTLVTPGTYHIFADVAVTAGASAGDDYQFKLRNETTSTDLTGSDARTTNIGASAIASLKLDGSVTTTTANNVIAIWGFNNTAARGTVNSARTRVRAIREH